MKAVNLIPREQRPTGRASVSGPAAPAAGGPTPVGAYAILGALVFAVAAMALMVLANNDIKKNRADAAQAEHDASVVEAQAASLQAFADFKQISESRVATVKALAGARFDWASTLDDVSRSLPRDVFISSLNGTTASGDGAGTTSSASTAILAPSITLSGCTTSQASVARLMSRLRDVRGVTRVSLSKSASTDTAAAAAAPAPATAADGSTPSVTTEPGPKGTPPAFDVAVYFERAVVSPGAVPNGLVAVGGPTGPTGPTGPAGAAGATTPASSTSTTP